MKPKKSKMQARPLTFTIDTRETYKASMQSELQKFGREDEPQQLALFRTDSQAVEVKTAGLDLSITEDKALSAVQKLLDKTDYKGNLQGQEVTSVGFKNKFFIPKLSFTWREYFEAYGLKEFDGRYAGRTAQEAREALLQGLTKERPVCYERKRWTGSGQNRRQLVDIIRTTAPLVRFCEYFDGLTKEEARKVEAGEPMTERVTKVVVEVSPLLMDGIENFFLLKPASLHQEITLLSAGKPTSRAVSLFIEWLLTLDMAEMPILKNNLATKLRKGRLVQQRKRKELDGIIEECLVTAKTLGYLLGYTVEAGGLLILKLNPERCLRVRRDRREAGHEEDSN